MSKPLHTAHYLPGVGPRAGHQRKTGRNHAVEECRGDNFSTSLCGKTPQGRSLGWLEDREKPIDCAVCLARLPHFPPTEGDARGGQCG